MSNYYLGGYYLLLLQEINFGFQRGKKSYTCSTCINEHLFEDWAFSWAVRSNKEERRIKKLFAVTDATIGAIRRWTDERQERLQVGWCNVFAEAAVAEEYRRRFFAHIPAVEVLSIYFHENEREQFLAACAPDIVYENLALTGLHEVLKAAIPEAAAATEICLGFDLIAVETSGHFHSFQCQDWKELIAKFGLRLNEWGLLEECDDWQPVLEYLHEDTNGFEPLPWFVVKVKKRV